MWTILKQLMSTSFNSLPPIVHVVVSHRVSMSFKLSLIPTLKFSTLEDDGWGRKVLTAALPHSHVELRWMNTRAYIVHASICSSHSHIDFITRSLYVASI